MTSHARHSSAAFYPGSFDPMTNGHVDIVRRALRVFDRVIVAVARNSSKKPMFSMEERRDLVEAIFADEPRVEVAFFETLTVQAALSHGASVILRGLRGVSDFEYEFQLATMNKTLEPRIETLFLMTEKQNFYVSSKLVREVASLGGDVSELVPPLVHRALIERLGPPEDTTA
jgi:pantetheine-phosphate adenylyltransferase